MTLTQLKYIIAVDDHRHFATAAAKCYVTQPTLSMQIHKFEQELNILIFDRSKHPVIPTQKGELVIEQARLILKESDRLKKIIVEGKDEFNGTFRIGVIPSLAPYLLPFFIKEFTEQYPNLKIVVEEALTNKIIKKLHHDQLDVGIIAKQIQQKNIYQISLFREPFVTFASSNHPIAGLDKIDIHQLKDENIWLLRDGNYLRDQILDLCKKADIKINNHAIQIKSDNLETLKNLVENNMGLTLLPFLAARKID
ncbi:MAG TPA: LysR substrate-binding domain-containing protein, partial [Balneolales bacterium]|nr:LysR substrate-binding domain-containing protein [Balneolales bacterium]